jgi:hypothetical protein
MGVLENTMLAFKTLNISDTSFKNKTDKLKQSCLETAIKGKEHTRKIMLCIERSAQLESDMADEGSTIKKLAKTRADFYKSLLDGSNLFITLNEQHPFLEKILE